MVSNAKQVKDVSEEKGVRIRNGRPEIRTLDRKWKKVNFTTLVYHRGKGRWSVARKQMRKRRSYTEMHRY